jgi:hypothetical protein
MNALKPGEDPNTRATSLSKHARRILLLTRINSFEQANAIRSVGLWGSCERTPSVCLVFAPRATQSLKKNVIAAMKQSTFAMSLNAIKRIGWVSETKGGPDCKDDEESSQRIEGVLG